MSEQRCVVRAVSWRDLLPWLLIFRTFRLAISLPLLFLATCGAVLTPLGWRLAEDFFVQPAVESDATQPADPFQMAVAANRRLPGVRPAIVGMSPADYWRASAPYEFVYPQLTAPFLALFDARLTISQLAYFLFGGLWTLLVWAFFGGAIARTAAMHLGREERVGLWEAIQHACAKYGSYIAAPLYPLLATAAILTPAALLGFFFLGDSLAVVAGLLWVFTLLLGFLAMILLIGLMFGWPLMWGAIASESSDAFDALSRSYAYTYQRPLHYFFYVVLAAALGTLGWAVIGALTAVVIHLSHWGAAWGANIGVLWDENGRRLPNLLLETDPQGALAVGLHSLAFWESLLWTLAAGFRYSFFWCAATAIYLLLRRDVDQTEFDEIYIDDVDTQIGLPPLDTDSHGVAVAPDNSEDSKNASDSAEPTEKEHPDGE